jgi:hypothetical protein
LFVLTVIFSYFYLKEGETMGQPAKISKEQAIVIANDEVKKLEYEIANMGVKATIHNEPWNPYLPKDSTSQYIKERKDKLSGKQYWAVYYSPKDPLRIGGDVCIFIDSQTGDVVTSYRGK